MDQEARLGVGRAAWPKAPGLRLGLALLLVSLVGPRQSPAGSPGLSRAAPGSAHDNALATAHDVKMPQQKAAPPTRSRPCVTRGVTP
eukprot:4775118-Pyramimonas_sp.AAC.1